jgi:hypothetical protein
MLAALSDTQPPLFVEAGAVLLSAELVHVLICTHDDAERERTLGNSPVAYREAREAHAEALAEVRAGSELAGEGGMPVAVDTRRGCPCGQVTAR